MNTTTIRIEPGLGTGVYDYSTAAALLHVSPAQVRGWAEGYVRPMRNRSEPVLQSKPLPGILTFYDLIELVFVKKYRDAGVKLSTIKKTAAFLAEELRTPYPLADCRLETDGVQLLREQEKRLVNVADSQTVLEIVRELFKDIEFKDCLPDRWWPMGRDGRVVISPHKAFGQPVDCEYGTRTDIIYATYKAEEDVEAVATWYEISKEAVNAAIRFETEWRCAA